MGGPFRSRIQAAGRREEEVLWRTEDMGLELTRKKRDLGEGWELGERGLWESLPHIQR